MGQLLPLLLLSEDAVGIGCSHCLHDIRGGHETHEGENDDEQGAQDETRFTEGSRQGQSPNSNDEVEDVCKSELGQVENIKKGISPRIDAIQGVVCGAREEGIRGT